MNTALILFILLLATSIITHKNCNIFPFHQCFHVHVMLLGRAFPLGIGVVAGLIIEHFRSKPTERVNVDKEDKETTATFKLGPEVSSLCAD